MSFSLLIIEDDPSLNEMLGLHFEDLGYQVAGAYTCRDGLEYLRAHAVDLILLDQQLPDGTGLGLLGTIMSENPDQAVLMITGQHDLELAIDAIKAGAADFIHKPIRVEALEHLVHRVLENRVLSRELAALQSDAQDLPYTGELIGKSDAMLQISKEIGLSAESEANVLITGESGTGKEVVARLLHLHSKREGPFVAVNCAAIVDTLLESELFGHEKGAFTGAVSRKIGKFELAQNGTLFLDEIGELAAPLQAKLLRALQERVFERVGGTQQIHTNCRVIAATNRDLMAAAAEHRFREDLIYRIKVVSLHLPALRQRKEDIPLLTQALLGKIAQRLHKPTLQVSEQALERLTQYHWPGNVRELENVLTQAAVHARSGLLTPDLIHPDLENEERESLQMPMEANSEETVLRSLDQVEAEHIQQVLAYTGGHKGRTCEILGISRPALDRKIRKFGLSVPSKSD